MASARRRPRPRRRAGAGHRLRGARDPRPRRRACDATTCATPCGATGRWSRPGRCAGRSTSSRRTSCRSWSAPSARASTGCGRSGSATSRSPADEMLALQDAIGDVLSDTPMTRAALGDGPGGRASATRLRRARVLGLGHVPQARREPRAAVLRARRRPQRDVRRSRAPGSAARCPSPARTPSAPSSSASSPRSRAARGASSRAGGASRAARRCASRSRRSATAWSRSLADGTKVLVRRDDLDELRERGAVDAASDCCPASTRTRCRCRRRPSRCCRWPDDRSCRGRPAGSARCVIVGGAVAGTWTHEAEEGPARDRRRAVAAPDEGRAGGDRRGGGEDRRVPGRGAGRLTIGEPGLAARRIARTPGRRAPRGPRTAPRPPPRRRTPTSPGAARAAPASSRRAGRARSPSASGRS